MAAKTASWWRRCLGWVLGAFLAASPTQAVLAAPPGLLTIEVGPVARLIEGGESLELQVKVRCQYEGLEVLEAFIYIVHGGFESQFAGLPVSCAGRPNLQVSTVQVQALDFVFQPGPASASAYILLIDPVTQDTVAAGGGGTFTIH